MLRTRVRVGPASALILSLLFAALLTTVGAFGVFFVRLTPAYGQPSPLVLRVPAAMQLVSSGGADVQDVAFQHRRVVIPRGTVLDPHNEDHQAAMRWDQTRRPPRPLRLGAAFVLYLFGCLFLIVYMLRFGHNRLKLMRSQLGLIGLMAMTVLLAKALLVLTTLPAFWIPVSAVSFWAALGFDRRTALLVDIGVSFMIASFLRFDLVLLAVFLIRGVIATLLFLNRKQPRQMVLAGLASGLVAAVAFAALTILMSGPQDVLSDLVLSVDSEMLSCAGGGLLGGILANIGREPAELALGHVSRTRLLDLTDIESPLLRKMATEAPGSWEHSRAMANLAEAASASVGADSLLTRVGAYYHDLGKTVQHKYFVENLAPGEPSPHNDLAPEVSADAIMAHVVVGTKILREEGVPEPVVEFAYTHHGTQVVEYFWGKYKQQLQEHPPEPGAPVLTRNHFRYPGMKPMTKETAILMLVDSVEAASRTVQPPEHDKFEEMITRIVFHKLKSGQIDDSGLTITDLRIMTLRMAATLVNMFHGRIKYPWQHKKEKEEAEAAAKEAAERAEKEALAQKKTVVVDSPEAVGNALSADPGPSHSAGDAALPKTEPPPPPSTASHEPQIPPAPQLPMESPASSDAPAPPATQLPPVEAVSDEPTHEVSLPRDVPLAVAGRDFPGRDRQATVELPVSIKLPMPSTKTEGPGTTDD